MRIFKRSMFAALLAISFAGSGFAADYGLPSNIQDGNILHCFDWTIAQVKANLANIAAAGYGSVQLSPLQRSDVGVGSSWHDLYRPYDIAFKGGLGTESELQALCSEAANYGIKIIVDVVANHVDKTAGYHDPWWDSNGRVRWEGSCNYNSRYSITHGQLGDYGDINSESSEVQARAKAYVEKLKSLGVKGIRWDAAKHIATPSEGCGFWSTVTSVSGMYHYGEILNDDGTPINEYAKYMSVTDNRYSNSAAQNNSGIQQGYGGTWAVERGVASNKLVYWGESHDTYSNDEWSQNVDQSVIDRAYACVATRNGATALYFARPTTKGFNNIKVGKGTDAYKSKSISAVNQLRNKAGSAPDYCTTTGNAFSCTRQGIGAVIVMKGSGQISIANGGSYCPAGTYTDLVSGSTFTVTSSTISGNVGSTGIAVIIKDGVTPPDPNDPDDPGVVTGDMYILGNLKTGGWSTVPGSGCAMTGNNGVYTAKNVELVTASGETKCYFNMTDKLGSTWDDLNMVANRYGAATEGEAITLGTAATVVKYANNVSASGCLSWTIPAGTYDFTFDSNTMKLTVVNAGSTPDNPDNPDNPNNPTDPSNLPTINGVYLKNTSSWSQPYVWAWTDSENCTSSGSWPGDKMTKYNDTYWKWEVPSGKSTPTQIIFNPGGDNGKTADLTYVNGGVYDCGGTQIGTANGGGDNPNPDPTGTTIYYDNSNTNWSNVYIHYWSTPTSTWPGVPMTKVEGNIWKFTWTDNVSGLAGFLFDDGSGSGDNNQTADYDGAPVNGHLYKGAGGSKGAVTDQGVYNNGNDTTKPVVSANPGSTTFTESISVTLSSNPAGTIYYTTDGSTPTTSSSKYTSALTFTSTTTLNAFAVASDGTAGDVKTFIYTKGTTPIVNPGNSLNTNYYSVNPGGKVGSNRTVNVTINGAKATNALSNWTENDMIAQGVARDVAQAMKGNHERPIVDSYALYAAYDANYLYLGVQMVYTVWDLYGEGKQPGESKPYNMDGRFMLAFDLDPNKSFDGYIDGTKAIWNDNGQPGAKFNNGVDAVFIGSTKAGGVGTPGFFTPTPDGHASYDAAYCKSVPSGTYGYIDGLLPSITHIYGQGSFNFEPSVLTGNDGFVDLRGEIDDSAHTFYEVKLPLSLLGVSEDYIRSTGIGVMCLDVYGSSPVGGTPYDPSYFDNVKGSYSMDDSSSQEKEDEDEITYSCARVGGTIGSGVDNIATVESTFSVVAGEGTLKVLGAENGNVVVAGVDGYVYYNGVGTADMDFELAEGVYVVNVNGRSVKAVVK